MPTTAESASVSPRWVMRSQVCSKKLPLPLSTPSMAGSWPIMMVSASPMMNPLSTGSEMNEARNPSRSSPAAMATSPVASARAAVSTTASLSPPP